MKVIAKTKAKCEFAIFTTINKVLQPTTVFVRVKERKLSGYHIISYIRKKLKEYEDNSNK